MHILITGCNGQLGRSLQRVVDVMEHNYVFTGRGVEKAILSDTCKTAPLNITDYDEILKLLKEEDIKLIINCAAYTNVDLAEKYVEDAFDVNSLGVKNLARAAKEVGARMIHISTDYVFNGKTYRPYTESDITNPSCVYGASKRAGEWFVTNTLGDNGIVIRTSWLYSPYGKNFVKTMVKLAKNNNNVNVVFDQIGTPTFAIDLARAIKAIIDSDKWIGGTYHYSNEGVCSWYDFAQEIMDVYGLSCNVTPVRTEDFKTLAQRPHYTVLDKTKIKEKYHIKIRHWKDALKENSKIKEDE